MLTYLAARYNRAIVELKAFNSFLCNVKHSCYNRAIVELKVGKKDKPANDNDEL